MGRSSSIARDAKGTIPTRDGHIIAESTTQQFSTVSPTFPKWMVKQMQMTVIKMMMKALGASRSQKQTLALRRSRSQKQRPALRRQNAWSRDQQRRKRPLRRGRKCFSYRLVYTNFFNKFNSVFSLSLIFIHFHVFSYQSIISFPFHFHSHFQCTPRLDPNQSINQASICRFHLKRFTVHFLEDVSEVLFFNFSSKNIRFVGFVLNISSWNVMGSFTC